MTPVVRGRETSALIIPSVIRGSEMQVNPVELIGQVDERRADPDRDSA